MSNLIDQDLAENISQSFADPNRHLVEVPDTFAIARWRRDADVATIARCILGTLTMWLARQKNRKRALSDVDPCDVCRRIQLWPTCSLEGVRSSPVDARVCNPGRNATSSEERWLASCPGRACACERRRPGTYWECQEAGRQRGNAGQPVDEKFNIGEERVY